MHRPAWIGRLRRDLVQSMGGLVPSASRVSSMATVTYYVALAFTRGEDGTLVAREGMECANANAAVARAKCLAAVEGGAVAFSRTGDPAIGEFEPAEVFGRFGEVPDNLSEL